MTGIPEKPVPVAKCNDGVVKGNGTSPSIPRDDALNAVISRDPCHEAGVFQLARGLLCRTIALTNKSERISGLNSFKADSTGQITKRISYVKDGLFAAYYCNNQEVAVELYSQNGTIIYRSGRIPDGTVEELYNNGVLRKKIPFKDGTEHGLSIEYYPSGDVFEENNYRRGVLHGPSKTYRQDGTLWMDTSYKNGKTHGPFTSYHDNGSIENKTGYLNGKLHGSYVAYDKNGFVMEEGKFVRGKKQGIYRIYHRTGHPSRIETYKQGILVACEEFDEDGKAIIPTRIRQAPA